VVEIYTGMSALPLVGKNVKIIAGLVRESFGQFGCELFRPSNQTIFWYNHRNFLHKVTLFVSFVGASSNTERRKNHV